MFDKKKYSHFNLKLTPQRIAILDYLKGNKTHPSAEDIYKAVSKRFPTISLATVYNTLSALKTHGQLLKLNIDPSRVRYDPNTSPHHHLICNRCKTIMDVESDCRFTLPKTTFEVTGGHVEFYGVCQKCRRRTRQKGN